MFDRHVPEMDAQALVSALQDCGWDELVAQNRQLVLAAQWAAIHAPADYPEGVGRFGMVEERVVRYGGPGTPMVAEFAAAELAPEVRLSVYQAKSLIADAVDLKFRFPLIWAEVRRGRVRAFVVRQIAHRTRDLPLSVAGRIDRILVDKIINMPPRRIEHLVDAALVKADPERVQKLVQQAQRSRRVEFSQSTEHGIRGLYARLDAADAARLKATICRLTDILMNSPEPIAGVRYRDARTREEWETIALTTLADPTLAFRILVEHDEPELFTAVEELFLPGPRDVRNDPSAPFDLRSEPPADDVPADPDTLPPDDLDEPIDLELVRYEVPAEPAARQDEVIPPTSDLDVVLDAVPEQTTTAERAAAREAALRALVKSIDPVKLLPPVTMYVHLTDAALASVVGGDCTATDAAEAGEAHIARFEGVGPVLLSQVREWLGAGARVRVVPVVDPGMIPPVDAYEFPQRMREALWLRTPASVFPYSANTSRGMDINHTIPYRSGSPPGAGQTGLHNAGPLGRAEHRFVTHGRVSIRQPGDGTYLFKTRFGRVLITNPTGTFDLGVGQWARAVWQLACQQTMTKAA